MNPVIQARPEMEGIMAGIPATVVVSSIRLIKLVPIVELICQLEENTTTFCSQVVEDFSFLDQTLGVHDCQTC